MCVCLFVFVVSFGNVVLYVLDVVIAVVGDVCACEELHNKPTVY